VSSEEFIELNRTFSKLPREYAQDTAGGDLELSEAFGLRVSDDLNWDALLQERRVIILAPAGAGKTSEIRETAIKLRSEGKPAFFIRIEHISDNLEGAFEEGDLKEFEEWLKSEDEGWLFLDSIDEARLKDAFCFEEAVRKIAAKLKPAKQRVHLVMAGRIDAWRPKTDLDLCNKQFEYSLPKEKASHPDNEEVSHDVVDSEHKFLKPETQNKEQKSTFEVYSISNLSKDQIERFACGKGVSNISKFLGEIERQDTSTHTTRPQDLIDVIWFWEKYDHIGSRLELMQNSVDRRLGERRPNAAVASKVSINKVREGVKLIAGAATLMKESIIKIPDEDNNVGVDIRQLLSDWAPYECNTILGRPIFGGAIYGAVRFDRPAREFLTAEWLSDCLKQGASRKDVEGLFFQKTYGIEVLVPSMRSILSWLVLFDETIRKKACKIEPEVIFEGGDPSELPLEVRRKILGSVCHKISSDTSKRSVTDLSAVQRFANPDMAEDIKDLIKKYKKNIEITSFLMRMIWQGHIKQALPEAKSFALDPTTEKYVRIAAIKALKEIGSESDFKELSEALSSQEKKIDRRLLSSVVDLLEPTQSSIDWIFNVLENTKDEKKFSTDGLSYSLVRFAEKLDLPFVFELIKKVNLFLSKEPVIEKRNCEISKRFGWLVNCGGRAVEKLLLVRHSDALNSESISILSKIPSFKNYEHFESRSLTSDISELAKDWPDLNFALFWKGIEETRKYVSCDRADRLTYYGQAYQLRGYWTFGSDDFDRVKNEIVSRSFLDDKLVALSLAFQIYVDNDRPPKWRDQLKKIVQGEVELEERLSNMLRPPAQSAQQKKWKQQEYRWRKEDENRKKKRKKFHADWLDWLNKNVDTLKDSKLLTSALSKGSVLNAQQYLLDRMRKANDNSNKWTEGNWRDLIGGFGLPIAESFRDGLLLSWRLYKPHLRSEKDDQDGTPHAVIIGLSGLKIESTEVENWPCHLSEKEVELACRYAFQELNGFPDWFAWLCDAFPDLVNKYVLKEIDWELKTAQEGQEKHYVLDKISWGDEAAWDSSAPKLINLLEVEPSSTKYLGYLLKIIQGSKVISDEEITRIASKKCNEIKNLNHVAHWFAAWIGVEPDVAIKKFSKYLKTIKSNPEAVQLAMQVIVNLTGDRMTGAYARKAYQSPKHLKNLYLLIHKYIKVEEDIDRVGKGAYSPELRDNAQDARNGIFNILTNIQGKEAYLALVELAKTHPRKTSRSWMMHSARERAEKDTNIKIWNYLDIQKFVSSFKEKVDYPMGFWEKKVDVGWWNRLSHFFKSHIIGMLIFTVLGGLLTTFVNNFINTTTNESTISSKSIQSSKLANEAKIVADSIVITGWETTGDYIGYLSQLSGFYERHKERFNSEYLLYSGELKTALKLIEMRQLQKDDLSISEKDYLRGLVQSGEDQLEELMAKD